MEVMIDTGRRRPMRMPGDEAVVRRLRVDEQSVATTDSSEEARIGLVARADSRLLKRAYPEDEHSQVSHETIYRSLYVQARGVLKKELIRHLRSKRTMRRPRRAGAKRGQIVDLVSISKRPRNG